MRWDGTGGLHVDMHPGLTSILWRCRGYCFENRLKSGSRDRFVIIQVRDDSDFNSDSCKRDIENNPISGYILKGIHYHDSLNWMQCEKNVKSAIKISGLSNWRTSIYNVQHYVPSTRSGFRGRWWGNFGYVKFEMPVNIYKEHQIGSGIHKCGMKVEILMWE